MKIVRSIPAVAALFFIGAAHAAETINTECPVKGSETAGKKSSQFEIGFCCEKCKMKFDKAPKNFLQAVSSAEEGKCPVSGKAVYGSDKSTVTVGTCCNSCKGKFDKEPKKFIGTLK